MTENSPAFSTLGSQSKRIKSRRDGRKLPVAHFVHRRIQPSLRNLFDSVCKRAPGSHLGVARAAVESRGAFSHAIASVRRRTSRVQASGANQREPRSGTGPSATASATAEGAIPRCLQRFVRRHVETSLACDMTNHGVRVEIDHHIRKP